MLNRKIKAILHATSHIQDRCHSLVKKPKRLTKINFMTTKNKKTLFLISGILTGIVFISSIFDSEPGSLFGSIWLFRLGWLVMTVSSFTSYYNIIKSEKESN